jgi:hypothetical protein
VGVVATAQSPPAQYKITVNPAVVKPINGKLPASVKIAVMADPCQDSTVFTGFTLSATGGLTPSDFAAGKCIVTATLTIDPNIQAGTYSVILLDSSKMPVGHTEFAVTDATAGPTPPGLPPQVDAIYNVMGFKDCADAFGKRVAQALYCIQIKIGNNSGYPLQVAGMGFTRKLEELTAVGSPNVTIANNSYASTRAVLVHAESLSVRNVVFNILQASGLLMSASAPFFNRTNPKKNWLTFSTIVNGPLQQAYGLIFPDPVLRQLGNLDDQAFRDNVVIPNNSQIQTVLFVEKVALTPSLEELRIRFSKAAQKPPKKSSTSPATEAQTKQAQLEAQVVQDAQTQLSAVAKGTAENSTRPSRLKMWKGEASPLIVKLALGDLVIVGDLILYLQRVQVQTSASPNNVAVTISPLTPSVSAGAPQQFTAVVTGTSTTTVTWTVKCAATGSGACGSIDASGGLYTAPTTAPSPNTVTITATSTADTTKSAATTVTIIPALTITTTSLPSGKAASPYPQAQLSTTGGNAPYTYTVTGGSLPSGLNLSLSGVISGTPSTATGSTPASFAVTATDSSSPPRKGSATLTITITSP